MIDQSPPAQAAAPAAAGVTAAITLVERDGKVALASRIAADRPFAGRWELSVIRDGASSSTIQQGGAATLAAGGERELSRVTLGVIEAGDRWRAVLRIFEGDRLLAEESAGR